MEVYYQISWRRSASGHLCNAATVANGNLINGEESLDCLYGCSGRITSRMSYFCTYFSAEDDWTFGERRITYDFRYALNNTVTIRLTGSAWISEVGGSRNIPTTFSLTKRNDTGTINSSPQILPTPPLRLQQGCTYTIPLPVSDPDNDTIRCRWAVGSECGGICDKFPEAILDSDTCTITYIANNGTGYKAVAIMIEDYAPGLPYHPLSSVALQFLVLVYSSYQPCSSQIDYFGFPSITLHPSDKTVFWNQYSDSINLTLTCMTNETTFYYWERQNGSFPYNSIGRNNILTLIDVQPEDTGNYRCAAFINNSACCGNFSDYAAVTIINGTYIHTCSKYTGKLIVGTQ